jgi:hypothetical protein
MEDTCLSNADGDFLIVPQSGKLGRGLAAVVAAMRRRRVQQRCCRAPPRRRVCRTDSARRNAHVPMPTRAPPPRPAAQARCC